MGSGLADELRIEENKRSGKPLCVRCGGSGNELYSMYRRCSDCKGTGLNLNKEREDG